MINFSNLNNASQNENDKNKFLLSPKNCSKNISNRKSSNISEITNNIVSPKNIQSNTNLRFSNNRLKINYAPKSYAELKNNDLTNDKTIKGKVSNFKINIKNIKSKKGEINQNSKQINYERDLVHNNSRNLKKSNDVQNSSVSNNFITENDLKIIENINNTFGDQGIEKRGTSKTPLNLNDRKISYNNSNAFNNNHNFYNKLSILNSTKNSNKINIQYNLNKHLKTNSQQNCNINNNLKLDPNNKMLNQKKIVNFNSKIKFKNCVSPNPKNLNDKNNLKLNTYEGEKKNDKIKKNTRLISDTNLIDLKILNQERNNDKINKNHPQNIDDSEDSSFTINCYNDYNILDSKDYETKVSSNCALTVNQILTKTTKDDSISHTIKNLKFENSIKDKNIEGPEDLHFFYVNIFQKKKVFAPKFDY